MTTAVLSLEDRIDLLKEWFLNSGIQSEDGGFYAWQDVEDKSHSYLYSEITGYAITALSFLYKLTKDDIFLKRTEHAAQWILQNAVDPSGGILTRKYIKNTVEHYSFERGNIYSFDCGMVAFGMLKLYKITGDKRYLACAEKIINFLNTKMLKDDGLYHPMYDTREGRPCEENLKWSTQSGSFHCKLALCLCELAEINNDKYLFTAAKRLIGSSVRTFCKDGRFLTNISTETSHLHPYSYTLEGLIYYSYKTEDNSYKEIALKGFDWLAGLQEGDGGFPTESSGGGRASVPFKRSDIQAQILRLSYFMNSRFDRERLLEYILSFQNISRDPYGAFLFGADEKGLFLKHSNAWCSMFALQALYLASGKAKNDTVLEYLI